MALQRLACDSCDVLVLDMGDPEVASGPRPLGVRSGPAVSVEGRLAACWTAGGPDEGALRAAGIGQPVG